MDAETPSPPPLQQHDVTVTPTPAVRRVSRLALVAATALLAGLFLLSALFLPRRTGPAAARVAPSLADPERRIADLLAAAERERKAQEERMRDETEVRRALDAELPGIPAEYLPDDGMAQAAAVPSGGQSPAYPPAQRAAEPARDPEKDRLRDAMDSPVLVSQARASRPSPASPGAGESLPPDLLAALLAVAGAPAAPSPAPVAEAPAPAARAPHAVRPPASPFTLLAGSYIPATLASSVNSDLPGQASALVSQDVYDSLTGRHLLIPRGSRLVGSYNSDVGYGQDRLVMTWTRLVLPDGTRFEFDFPASDAAGAAGLADKVDRHLGRLYGSALLLSVVAAGAQLSQPDAYTGSIGAPTASEVASGALGQRLTDVSGSVLERELRVKPTLRLRPGTPFTVVITTDIVFPR